MGIGLDTFESEPELARLLRDEVPSDRPSVQIVRSALDHSENFYVQAHQGFNSDKVALRKAVETVNRVENYCKGSFASQLLYYL